MDYNEFLQQKQIVNNPTGYDPGPLNVNLKDFQRDITRWAIRRGRACVWAGTGLGKTIIQMSWADEICKHTGGNALVVAPLSVSKQTHREGINFGIQSTICRKQEDVKSGINITNYEMLDHFDAESFESVVIDECFSPDTQIEVFNIDNVLTNKYIKDVVNGDLIYNANGKDIVDGTKRKAVTRAIKLGINGSFITCSENHPFFTLHGWRLSQDLQPSDYIMATTSAVRLVWDDISCPLPCHEIPEVLRNILLSEMEDGNTRTQGKSPQSGSCKKTGDIEISMVSGGGTDCHKRKTAHGRLEPHDSSGVQSKDVRYIEKNRAQTFRAWGKWEENTISSAVNEGCIARKLDSGICYITGRTDTEFSNMLQSGLRESRLKNSHRTGWTHTSEPEGSGREKGQDAQFFRVDSLEVLELGHPELEKYRDESGVIYFYDIKARRHPSYSVNGLLVHNSGILKHFTSKTRNQIIDSFRNTKYKLACSATPAPNDFMEIGNHAEFVGAMTRTEMLSMFFVHDSGDTAKWRLKKHAQSEFWKWVCTWAVMLRMPSDLGYDDNGFILPILNMHQHVAKSPAYSNGELFPGNKLTLNDRRAARRDSIDDRAKIVKQLVDENPDDQWLIWCNLNTEADKLEKLLPDAIGVRGADSDKHKEQTSIDFADGKVLKLISKASIYGWGLNFQSCHKMILFGLSDSFEEIYQAIRRCWRYGQKHPVDVHVIISDQEGAVLDNIKRKETDFEEMQKEMVANMADINSVDIKGIVKSESDYNPQIEMILPDWII